jgi:hypothetical protein
MTSFMESLQYPALSLVLDYPASSWLAVVFSAGGDGDSKALSVEIERRDYKRHSALVSCPAVEAELSPCAFSDAAQLVSG